MTQNIKKRLERKETYIDKKALKHKHEYIIKHLLIVTNTNKEATGNNYNKKEYYYVLKCNKCNSFIPDTIEGNYNHIINKEEINNELPVITANTEEKTPHYSFSKLIDVKIKNIL